MVEASIASACEHALKDLSGLAWMGFEDHLSAPRGLGALAGMPHSGAAGGAACGDLVRVTVRVEDDRVVEAGFDAEGCGAARAAGSAVVELVEGRPFLEAAQVMPDDVSGALGGLIPPKRHAAELAADALHRALGAAAKGAAEGAATGAAEGAAKDAAEGAATGAAEGAAKGAAEGAAKGAAEAAAEDAAVAAATDAAVAGEHAPVTARDGAPGFRLRLAPNSRRTLVAMSGGVDSAAAAQLALDAGDEVVAVTLELWSDPATDGERSCCSPQAVTGARALAHRMGIPHVTLDLRERFRAEVVDRFLDGYAAGLTPNPCVRCNGEVRFDAMLDLATALGAARLATGHYARIARDARGPLVRAAVDPRKDQSYMLAKLDPALLERLSFPLGGLTKDAVRALARDAGLPVADKRESQDLCFVAGLGGRAFLRRHGGPRLRRPGEIVDRDGRVLGRHEGQHEFTVGQRRGLGVHSPEPLYVIEKDAETSRVTVGRKHELATTTVRLEGTRLHRAADQVRQVRLRYHAEPIACRAIVEQDGEVRLELGRAAHAVAPGQLACLMRDDCVVGEGTIAESG